MAFPSEMLKSADMLLYNEYYVLSIAVQDKYNLSYERMIYFIWSKVTENGKGCGNFKIVNFRG